MNLRTLNAYPEFATAEGINSIKLYVRNGVLPAGLNARQKKRFEEKFGTGFSVRDGDLLYRMDNGPTLEVVLPAERDAKIKAIYDDPKRGLGVGLMQFYQQVSGQYLNITKRMTDDFLHRQGDFQVTRVPEYKTTLTIKTSAPNERWSIDIIDMSMYDNFKNHNDRYIFTCVDYFSGKVWARALKNRENGVITETQSRGQERITKDTLANALKSIIAEAQSRPHILQVDNEFNMGSIKRYCISQDIKVIAVLSFQSFTNGKIERANREFRKKTKAFFVRNNNLIWADHLQDIVDNINSQKQARTGRSPDEMWTRGYNPTSADRRANNIPMAKRKIQAKQRQYLQERAKVTEAHNKAYQFQQGDLVRVKLLSYSSPMRKKRKSNMGWNQVAVHYSPDLYEVQQVMKHRDPALPTEYTLKQGNQMVVKVKETKDGPVMGKHPRKFRGHELILVRRHSVPTHVEPKTLRRAHYLNRVDVPNIARRR